MEFNNAYEPNVKEAGRETGAVKFDVAEGGSPKANDKISDMEPIDSIKVPKTWSKEVDDAAFENMSKAVTFRPPDAPGAVLSVYDRGMPIASSQAAQFKSVLEKDPHSLTPGELKNLGKQVLGNLGDQSAFDVKSAETKMINGKKVLAVEGNFKEGGKHFYGCFIPRDETCKQIQEVYFEGANNTFHEHRDQAMDCIHSIKWKRDVL